MADIDRLIEEFAADYEAGRPADPAQLLDRVDAGQRQELASRLDRYLMTAPARRWDPEAFEGSLAQIASDRVYESIEGVSGSWPEVLPRLRNQARIKRRELVERLAGALGFGSEPEIAKVGDYYNRMEHGRLPAAGVSQRVITELAGLLGVEPERIAATGARRTGSGGAEVAFARTAFPDAEFADEELLVESMPPPAEAERDEIDALFLDG
ncbi:MAG: hypothetical protein R2718_13585 [Solirubrobacterales bacterium]